MVPHTGQALQGRCVTSGTSQEPQPHDGARETQHPKLSPLEAPRRPPRRFPRESHALSRMSATAGWRSQGETTHRDRPVSAIAAHRTGDRHRGTAPGIPGDIFCEVIS